jgi:hypothetical protein
MHQKSLFNNFVRNVKRVFNNVLKVDLEHVRCLTADNTQQCVVKIAN